MYYVVTIKILSNGNYERTIAQWPDIDTALRKYHEAFSTIGGGPKKISALLLADKNTPVYPDAPSFDAEAIFYVPSIEVVKNETWAENTGIVSGSIINPDA